jgi:choline-sulfatase
VVRPESGRRLETLLSTLVLTCAGAAWLLPAQGKAPNLLLITVDTLRPDALGWVSGKNETPAIDRLAREGFRFPRAVAQAPLTFPSHASMMTGLAPRRLGVRDNGQMLSAGPATIAEALSRRGYATAAFVSGYPLSAIFGLDRGFALYDDHLTSGSEGDLERPAAATTAAALAWLRSAKEPWFAWVHYYDPHYPYEPPPGFRRPGWRGAYDGEVACVDRAIGELIGGLEPRGGGETATVFAADHGESLGEHGEGTHGFFIYDSTVSVPLVFRFPGRVRPGQSLQPARLIDVAPTVLELVGGAPLAGTDGVSLAPTLAGLEQKIPAAFIETYQPWTSYGWSPLKAVRQGSWKLIAAPRPELYDLEKDPAEARNLLDQNRAKARELGQLLRQAEVLPAARSRAVGDADAVNRLRALGYLSGGGSSSEPPATGLRDPKDGAKLRDVLTEADQLLRRGDYRGAVTRFEAVLAEDPRNRFATLRSGFALVKMGDLRAAIPRLERSVELDPNVPEARTALAEALTKSRLYDRAARQWMEAIRLQPRRAEAWAGAGAALGLGGKPQEAVKAFERAVELEPRNPGLLARLAFAEHAAGRFDAAARHLQQTAGLTGEKDFSYSGSLGVLLVKLGRREQARSWLAKSRPNEGDFGPARLELAVLESEAGRREEARRALREALSAAPGLRSRAEADKRLAPLLP